MAQRKSVRGSRSSVLWLPIILVLVLAIALAAVVFVIGPERQLAVQATATAQAHASEVQRAYDAGVAFATAGDWEKAAEEFARVVSLDPGYKDAAARLAEARGNVEAAKVAATAQAVAMAERIAATATAETALIIEQMYQRGLAYSNLERWEQAKMEFERVIAGDPNYKDVQAKLAEVETKLAEIRALPPTATPLPLETPTPTPSMTSPPMPESELRLSELAAASGRDYQVEYNTLQRGELQYTDREYMFTSVPPDYEGLTYIKTACDDKGSRGTRFLVFKVNRDVRVYIAYDDRITELPLWLRIWEPTGDTLRSSTVTYNLFQKDFPAGWVELGGAYAWGDAMYSVLILPK